MSIQPRARDWRLASADILRCFTEWQVWALLGVSDVRRRYMRSRLGQFWITFSMGIFVAGIGLVYGGLFHATINSYVPYLAVNMTVWTLMSGTINDGTLTFVEASPYLKQESMAKTIFVMRILVRNMVAFGHNLIILPIVFVLFLVAPSPVALLAVPGLALLLVGTFFSTLALGILCTRFRDLPQIVANMLQLAFFVTPIMWQIEQLGRLGEIIKVINPFASFLRIVSEPILGRVPDLQTYASVFIYLSLLIILTLPLFARFRARIVYWL